MAKTPENNQKSGKTGETKKPPVLRSMPKTVTKGTDNYDGGDNAVKLEDIIADTVNADVFDSADSFFPETLSRSRTIDGTMLPKSRFKKKRRSKKNKTKSAEVSIESAERFDTDIEAGLSPEQVERRGLEGLTNTTKKRTSKTYSSIFLSNIFTPINIIAAAVAAALLATKSPIAQYLFVVIIAVNMSIGIFQEIRAKMAVEKLNLLSAPTATVIRNGEKIVIPVAEIVLDDIMLLESGKQICADAVVVKGEIEVNESLLTGESNAVKKIPSSELYSGSFVVSGNAYARVDKVGEANYVETLASHVKKYKKPKSELFNSINFIMKIVIPLALIIATATLLLYYFTNLRSVPSVAGKSWTDNIQKTAGVIIGMLPTGMFLLTSTALFVSVVRLAKRRTLVKDLYCIEMLARVDVLCLDKTGTITDGTMVVKDVVEIKGSHEVQYSFGDIIGSVLTATGDNNQTAMALANRFGYSTALSPTAVLPFSSQRKLAAASFGDAGTFLYGAPEFVLRDVGVRIEKLIGEYAAQGLRVLVLAHSPGQLSDDKLPSVRRPLCLIAIEDHIRPDAIETVKWFKENNVQAKVISGDNPQTVSEVAKRVGIENAELYISLEGLSNQEIFEAAQNYTVFGRVTPEQKMLLVRALKQKGHTVAMTGDGVNDILAMRESDCAVAIASGAEAARNVAHLVLQDSSFVSMPQVVREGRRVVNNIQQTSSLFLMKTFMTMLLSVIALMVPGMEYPYKTSSLLLLEFCIIAVSSFALALQKNDNLIKGKFLSNVIGRSAPGGITLAAATMAIYLFYRLHYGASITYAATYETMLVLVVTFTGFMILVKICEPVNIFRTVLLVAVGGLSAILAFTLPGFFGISKIQFYDWFFLILTVLGAYFFMSVLIKIMRALKILN